MAKQTLALAGRKVKMRFLFCDFSSARTHTARPPDLSTWYMPIRNSTLKRITLTRSLNGLSFGRQFIRPPHAHANYEHVNEVTLTMEAVWIRLLYSVLSFALHPCRCRSTLAWFRIQILSSHVCIGVRFIVSLYRARIHKRPVEQNAATHYNWAMLGLMAAIRHWRAFRKKRYKNKRTLHSGGKIHARAHGETERLSRTYVHGSGVFFSLFSRAFDLFVSGVNA